MHHSSNQSPSSDNPIFEREPFLSYYRARYYDQSVGRFLGEDPAKFYAGPNFYRYVRNHPTLLKDPTGLITTLPPDPGLNTVICNGQGRMRVQLGNLGTLGGPKEIKCLEDCARAHEESHLADDMAANPMVCKGQAVGVMVGFSNPEEQKAGEVGASNAELECLRNQLDHGCKDCGPIILNRIGDVEAYRDFFQNKK
jgi:RHS repeat-associated protein